MKGRGAARAPGGREGEGGLQTPDRGPGARRPRSAALPPPPGSCLAATGTSARGSTARQGPGCGLAPLVPGSSGMGASPGRDARAWALSSSPRAAPETAGWRGGRTVVARPLPDRAPARAELPGSHWVSGTCFGVVWGFQSAS